jgi:protein-S-isoprenylcysteine O-methyltransferase Ste14
MPTPNTDRPNVIAFPPLLYLVTLGAGLLLHQVVRAQLLPPIPSRIAGAALVIFGAAIGKWGEVTMRKAGTNVDPRQAALAIVTAGPFRFTRNPLYLGLIALYLGITLLVDALAPLILLPILLLVTHFGIIRREERYLEAKFGPAYLEYKRKVRRYV